MQTEDASLQPARLCLHTSRRAKNHQLITMTAS